MDDWMMELRRSSSAWARDPFVASRRRVISPAVPRCAYARLSTYGRFPL